MWNIYEIIHAFVLRLQIKVKNDHRSKFSNLSNWKEEAWKNQGFNRIRTRDLRDTGAMLYQLSYEAIHWERGQFIEFILVIHSRHSPNVWLHSSVGRSSHRYRGGHGFESCWSLDFFRLPLSNCLNWKIYCDDHSSLWLSEVFIKTRSTPASLLFRGQVTKPTTVKWSISVL